MKEHNGKIWHTYTLRKDFPTSITKNMYLFNYFADDIQVLLFCQISVIQYSGVNYSHRVIRWIHKPYSSYSWKVYTL